MSDIIWVLPFNLKSFLVSPLKGALLYQSNTIQIDGVLLYWVYYNGVQFNSTKISLCANRLFSELNKRPEPLFHCFADMDLAAPLVTVMEFYERSRISN